LACPSSGAENEKSQAFANAWLDIVQAESVRNGCDAAAPRRNCAGRPSYVNVCDGTWYYLRQGVLIGQ